jgi:hypothetical protein
MVNKIAAKLFFAGMVVLILTLNVYSADVNISVDLSQNFPPVINSIKTFSSYTSSSDNIPSNNFSAPSNRTVYVQINVSDPNGYEDINNNGYVGVKIVLWNTTDEEVFARFGSDYVNATLESGSVRDAVYTFSFPMDDNDDTRLGDEVPPQFFRVKAEVSDGTDVVESNTSSEQVADYTYNGLVLFNLSIDIPGNKKVIRQGDSFYATVQVTKVSPLGLDEVSISYSIINPMNNTVDYYTENVAINGTVYRLPVLYVPSNAMTGRYTFRVLVMYLGVGSWTEAYFDVVSRNGGGLGGGGQGGVTTTTETAVTTTLPQKTSLEFYSVPHEVYAFQGESKPVMVIIENTGNVTVSDVNLELTTSLEVENILPEDITINPGEKKVFILEVWVDENAAEGTYPSQPGGRKPSRHNIHRIRKTV